MCLKELRDEFLYDCECRHLAKGSLRNYRASTRFLLEFLERKQITELEDVRPRHLRDLMKEKQDAGNTPRYINDLLKVWRTWFNYLVEEGYLEERDTFAQMQLKNGLDLYSVSRLMGHVNIMITQRYLLGIKDKDIVDRGTQSELLSRCPLYQALWAAHVGAKTWAVTSGEKEGN